MPHKSGGKITDAHSTLSDVAKEVVEFLQKVESVKRISIGVLTPATGGIPRLVKMTDEDSCVLITIRQKGSVQDIRFSPITGADAYSNLQYRTAAKLALAKFVVEKGWKLLFPEKTGK